MKGTMSNKFPYTSTLNAMVTIIKTESILGLYKGVIPNLLKVAPSMGVAFATYEFVKSRLFGVPILWQ